MDFGDKYYNEALEYLAKYKLDDRAAGITKRYLAGRKLVGRQDYVFQTHVIEPYFTQNCERCGRTIEDYERIGAWINGGCCEFCTSHMDRD